MGDDDLIGGSSELASGSETGHPDANDNLYGGAGQDVIAGDNARITRSGVGHPLMTGRGLTTTRAVDLADEGSGTPTGLSGDDTIEAGDDTDLVFGQRGADTISLGGEADYGEGGPGVDRVHGDAGDDDVVGGSYTPAIDAALEPTGQPDNGDFLFGDAGQDVVLGDNGAVTRPASTGLSTTFVAPVTAGQLTTNRVTAARSITPYDLGDTLLATDASGPDTITGDDGDPVPVPLDLANDVLLGQGGNDRVDGGIGHDYAEGGQDSDLVLGGSDDDDVVGGSSATVGNLNGGATGQPDASDNVYGGSGSDLAIGDNGLLTRVTTGRDWRTDRVDATQSELVPGRAIALFDLNPSTPLSATSTHAAADSLSGQAGVDVMLGQDGNDRISGGSDDDYIEGEGGMDAIHGDVALVDNPVSEIVPASAWTSSRRRVRRPGRHHGRVEPQGLPRRQRHHQRRRGRRLRGRRQRLDRPGGQWHDRAGLRPALRPDTGRPRQGPGRGWPGRRTGRVDAVLHCSYEPVADLDVRGGRRLRCGHHPRRRRSGRALRPGR